MKRSPISRLRLLTILLAALGLPACDREAPRGTTMTPPPSAAKTGAAATQPTAPAAAAPNATAASPSASPKKAEFPDDTPVTYGKTAFPDIKPRTPKDAADEPPPAPKRDLGPPLVDNFKELIKLSPSYPTWIDPQKKRVVLVGEVCRATMGLEMFASLLSSEKDYESVIVVDTKAAIVHAALLKLGATPGQPVQFVPEYRAAWGTEVDIDLIWKNAQGQRQQAPAQEWMRDVHTHQPLPYRWVFAGSSFWKEPGTGREFYLGEGGYLICVANTSSAVLDLPIRSSGGLESREFETNVDRVPPRGTPVTLLLTPRLDRPLVKPGDAPPGKPAATKPTL